MAEGTTGDWRGLLQPTKQLAAGTTERPDAPADGRVITLRLTENEAELLRRATESVEALAFVGIMLGASVVVAAVNQGPKRTGRGRARLRKASPRRERTPWPPEERRPYQRPEVARNESRGLNSHRRTFSIRVLSPELWDRTDADGYWVASNGRRRSWSTRSAAEAAIEKEGKRLWAATPKRWR